MGHNRHRAADRIETSKLAKQVQGPNISPCTLSPSTTAPPPPRSPGKKGPGPSDTLTIPHTILNMLRRLAVLDFPTRVGHQQEIFKPFGQTGNLAESVPKTHAFVTMPLTS